MPVPTIRVRGSSLLLQSGSWRRHRIPPARVEPVWKVVYSSSVPLLAADQSEPPLGKNAQKQIQLTFAVVEDCSHPHILETKTLPDLGIPIDFRDRDLGIFVQYSRGQQQDTNHSNVYRASWHYSCGTEAACDRVKRFSIQLDHGRTYLNTTIPADFTEMSADAELAIATEEPGESQMLPVTRNLAERNTPAAKCNAQLFDMWAVRVQGKLIVVSEDDIGIDISP